MGVLKSEGQAGRKKNMGFMDGDSNPGAVRAVTTKLVFVCSAVMPLSHGATSAGDCETTGGLTTQERVGRTFLRDSSDIYLILVLSCERLSGVVA